MGDNREQPPMPKTLPGNFELVKPGQDDEATTMSPEVDINPDVQALTSFETYEELIDWLEKNKNRSFMYSPDADELDTRVEIPYSFILDNIRAVYQRLFDEEINELELVPHLRRVPSFRHDYHDMGIQIFRYRVAKLIGQAVRRKKGRPLDA